MLHFRYETEYRISFPVSNEKPLQLQPDPFWSSAASNGLHRNPSTQAVEYNFESTSGGRTAQRQCFQDSRVRRKRPFATTAEDRCRCRGSSFLYRSEFGYPRRAKWATKGNTTGCNGHRSGGVRSATSRRSTTPEKVALLAIRGGEPLASAGTLMASE